MGLGRFGRVGESAGNMLSLLSNVERGDVARRRLNELWLGVRRLTHKVSVETFQGVCMIEALLHPYCAVST